MECVFFSSLSRFPFYYELKIAFVAWLLSPYTKGSSLLYRKFVHPTLSSKEKVICVVLPFTPSSEWKKNFKWLKKKKMWFYWRRLLIDLFAPYPKTVPSNLSLLSLFLWPGAILKSILFITIIVKHFHTLKQKTEKNSLIIQLPKLNFFPFIRLSACPFTDGIFIYTTKKYFKNLVQGFPAGSVVKNLPASAGDTGLIPGLGGSYMRRSS